MCMADAIKNYWDNRASLGATAGTQDLIAKQLEIEAIAKYVKDGMSILDAGCGNGITALELAKRYNVDIMGIDYSPQLISAACTLVNPSAKEKRKGRLNFAVGDLTNPLYRKGTFDLVYTERAVINLPDWSTQKATIEKLADISKGYYLMCECSQDGLDRINELRHQLRLPTILPPWHDRYLRDEEIETIKHLLEKVEDFSSTYYFLSRVVNAWLAELEGKEPDYEAPVNTLALKLPSFGNMGQVKLWVWKGR